MEKIFTTQKELALTLKGFKGSSLCTIEMTNEVKANKKGRVSKVPFTEAFRGTVYRSYKESGTFGISYENSVNNQLKRESKDNDFVSESLRWGQWYDVNKIIEHKGNFYLRYFVNMNANSKNPKGTVYHYADGTKLTQAEIARLAEYLPPKSSSSRQGTAKEIEPRAVKFSGINKLKVGGVTLIKG